MSATTRINTHELTQRKKIEVALGNEQLTRQRVDSLEASVRDLVAEGLRQKRRVDEHEMLLTNDQNLAKWLSSGFRVRLIWLVFGVDWNLDRGFFGRLRWLFLGK